MNENKIKEEREYSMALLAMPSHSYTLVHSRIHLDIEAFSLGIGEKEHLDTRKQAKESKGTQEEGGKSRCNSGILQVTSCMCDFLVGI